MVRISKSILKKEINCILSWTNLSNMKDRIETELSKVFEKYALCDILSSQQSNLTDELYIHIYTPLIRSKEFIIYENKKCFKY